VQSAQLLRSTLICIGFGAMFLGSGSNSSPTINLQPSLGPSHTLVTITGEDLANAQIIWDATKSNARALMRGGDDGQIFFSVPSDAMVGEHLVAIKRNGTLTPPIPFRVTAVINTKPRIDGIDLFETTFGPGNKIRTIFFVYGANIDVGATVHIIGPGDVELATDAHHGFNNQLFGMESFAQLLGNPITSYLGLIATPGPLIAGSNLNLAVRNDNGMVSELYSVTLPTNATNLDSDADGLTDVAEMDPKTATRLNLPPKILNPHRKNLFVEVDLMLENPVSRPPEGIWTTVRKYFGDAPTPSLAVGPDGTSNLDGIDVYIDASGTVNYAPSLSFTKALGQDKSVFGVLKSGGFGQSRKDHFFYGIWGDTDINRKSGRADVVAGTGLARGDDFYVTLGNLSQTQRQPRAAVETFIHELGHVLGQRHGGVNDSPAGNPGHLSVMSYRWLLRFAFTPNDRLTNNTMARFYWQKDISIVASGERAGTELDGLAPSSSPAVVTTYSEGMGKGVGSLADTAGWPGINFAGPRETGIEP
jgi:hypothetical protein